MLLRKFVVTGVVALGLVAAIPAVVHADDKPDAAAAAAASDKPAASDAAAATDDDGDEPAKADTDKAGDKAAAEPAKADGDKAAAASSKEDDAKLAAIKAAMVHGPAKVSLGDQAVVDMPKDFIFLPKEQAVALMEEMGNHMDQDNFYGLFMSADDAQTWFIAASFDDSGFIKDDDQSKIDADSILADMKKGVDEDNEDRKTKGISQLEIVGWIEKPHYDAKAHQLVWSIEAKEFGSADATTNDNSINYNTFALGRGGFISLNLVSKRSTIESDRKAVGALLSDLKFNDGKKYENFDPKTDKVAEYGLMALIGGIAAHKLGLFAVLIGLGLKFKAVAVAAAVGASAAVKKFFKRRDPTV